MTLIAEFFRPIQEAMPMQQLIVIVFFSFAVIMNTFFSDGPRALNSFLTALISSIGMIAAAWYFIAGDPMWPLYAPAGVLIITGCWIGTLTGMTLTKIRSWI